MSDIKKMLIGESKSIAELIDALNRNGKGAIFVVGEDDKLKGVVTDGDIRRALLKGLKIKDKVINITAPKFIYANEDDSIEQINSKFNDKIKILPIVNSDFQVVDFSEFTNKIKMPIASPDLAGNEFKYLVDAFVSTWISSTGEYIKRFEQGFSEYCNCRYGVAVSNGTAAIHLALVTLGIGPGDEVIVPDLTFAASVNPIIYNGGTPVIVDVEKESWCIDPKEIEKAITRKTKAIIPVHLYGQPCNMSAIMKIAKRHNLFVIEDCAEAHGAEFKGKKVGSFGDIGCFSFFANKIITTGEGGMCVTNNEKFYNKMCLLRDHGMNKDKKYWHDEVGYNYRMTNLQAAIGVAQLERIGDILSKRTSVEEKYISSFANVNTIEFQKNNLPDRKKITWLICALVDNRKRDKYMKALGKAGIDTRPFFYPLSSMKIYQKYSSKKNLNSNTVSSKGINFPTTNDLAPEKIERIKKIFEECPDV